MKWEQDQGFNQMGSNIGTFCCALVVGWLSDEPSKPFNRELFQLQRAQLTLRESGREAGLPELLASRGLKEALHVANNGKPFSAELVAKSVSVLRANGPTRILIEVQGNKGEHAFGVRWKPTKMEFFDPNHGVWFGDEDDFLPFLDEYLKRYYSNWRMGSFLATSVGPGGAAPHPRVRIRL